MEDCDQCKVFVGGISWETTEDVLREHFRNYGNVISSVIAKDRITGTPRGFAFVSFADSSALDKVLGDSHNILGRTVEVKKAVPRGEQYQIQQEQNRGGQNRNYRSNNGTKTNDNNNSLKTKKIFVGGLSANLTEDDFKIYFEKFGRITDVVVMHDNVTHRPRGFGFITFDTEDSVEQVMQKNFHELCGKLVEVKRAVPKEISGTGGATSGNRDFSSSNFNGQQQALTQFRPTTYEILPSYGPFGYGGYPVYGGGPYPVSGYGLTARAPWVGPAMVSMRPLTVYPTAYMNGGLMGMAATNGYNGMVGPVPGGMPGQLIGNVVDNNSLMSSGGGLEGSKNDQSGGTDY